MKWIAAAIMLMLLSLPAFSQYQPSGHMERDVRHARLVVFVHGVIGDKVSTFTSPDGVLWPTLAQGDPLFDDVDVFSYNYFTSIFEDSPSVTEIASDFADILKNDAQMQTYGSVVFVAHSLGGIVVRKLLIDHPELRPNVAATYLLGSPTLGSDFAGWIAAGVPSKTLKELAGGSDPDAMLNKLIKDWFAEGLSTIPSFCAYETEEVAPFVFPVHPKEAVGLCNRSFSPMAGMNHNDLPKPNDLGAPQHVELQHALEDVFPNEGGAIHREPVDVVIATCKPDEYGPDFRRVFAERLEKMGKSYRASKMLHDDFYPRDLGLLFGPTREAKLLAIHYSCFQDGKEDKKGNLERRDDFRDLLKALRAAGDPVKLLVYSSALDSAKCKQACFLDFAFGNSLYLPDYKVGQNLFLLPISPEREEDPDTLAQFESMVTAALK